MEESDILAFLLDGNKPDIVEVYGINNKLLGKIEIDSFESDYDISDFSEFKTDYTQIWIKESSNLNYYDNLNNIIIFHNTGLLIYVDRKTGDIMECYRWKPEKILSKIFVKNLKLIDDI